MLLGQAGRKMLESDWTSLHFRLSCHSLEPFIERERIEASRTDMIRGSVKSWGRLCRHYGNGDLETPGTCLPERASYPQAPDCLKARKMFNFRSVAGDAGCSAISDRGASVPGSVIQFASKPTAKPGAGDPLDQAAQA
jgi:hypothetical protein